MLVLGSGPKITAGWRKEDEESQPGDKASHPLAKEGERVKMGSVVRELRVGGWMD